MNTNWNFIQCYWVTVNYFKIGNNELAVKKIMESANKKDGVEVLISFFVYCGLNRNESLEMKFLKSIKKFDPDLDETNTNEFIEAHQNSNKLDFELFVNYFCSNFDFFDTLQKLNLRLARRHSEMRNLYLENF